MSTEGPWTIHESTPKRSGISPYIEIRGPNGEAICTIFPDAGKGGVGIEQARANAQKIAVAWRFKP